MVSSLGNGGRCPRGGWLGGGFTFSGGSPVGSGHSLGEEADTPDSLSGAHRLGIKGGEVRAGLACGDGLA